MVKDGGNGNLEVTNMVYKRRSMVESYMLMTLKQLKNHV